MRAGGTLTCTAEFLPDGSLLLDKLDRLDGGITWFTAYDYDPFFDGDEGPVRDEVALPEEVLDKLATNDHLHW